jgi:hypothetical protein
VRTLIQTFPLVVALSMFTSPSHLFGADTFPEAARALADKIVAAAGPLEHFKLTFRNLASLDPEQAADAWRIVENEFRSRGIRSAAESDATAQIRITLSENPQDFLWVAEITRGQAREQLMVVQTRPQGVGAAGVPPRMVIRTELLFEADDPILDLAYEEADLLVLDPVHLSLYRRLDDHWNLEHAAALMESRPIPRDARGRLKVQGASIHAYLPGLDCSGTARPDFTLDCVRAESLWPIESGPARYESARNFFVQGDLPPFFSSAGIREDEDPLWILAGTDGRARLYDKAYQQAGTITGWGSDIAGVNSACGTRHQVFVALPGDPSERGDIQAFEIIRRQAVAVTSAAEFPGPITALWPLSTGDAAFAVTRDVKTGRYAAYHLSIACGH